MDKYFNMKILLTFIKIYPKHSKQKDGQAWQVPVTGSRYILTPHIDVHSQVTGLITFIPVHTEQSVLLGPVHVIQSALQLTQLPEVES